MYNQSLTVNCVHCRRLILRVQVPQPLAHDHGQLNLIVQVDAARADDGTLAGKQDRRRRLQEKEGLLGPGAVELADVVPGRCVRSVGTTPLGRDERE